MSFGKKLFLLIYFIFCAFSIYAAGENTQIIIESGKGGKNFECYSEQSSNWLDSTGKSVNDELTPNLGSRYTEAARGGVATAKFTPEIKEDGNYEVFVIWPKQANASPVSFEIKSAEDTAIIKRYMNGWGGNGSPKNGDTWHSLGVYHFKPGKDGYLTIKKEEPACNALDTRNSCRIYADAAKFIKTDASPAKGTDETPAVVAASSTTDQSATTAAPAQPAASSSTSSTAQTSSGYAVLWTSNLEEAKQKAASENKNLLLYFFSSKSNDCSKYEEEVFKDKSVIEKLNAKFVCVLIDFPSNYDYSLKLGVFKAPAMIFYNKNGDPLKKIDGFLSKDDFLTNISIY